MYRNSVNRILTRAVNTLTVYCDRGDLVKAKGAVEDVYQAIDALMDATVERVNLKEMRQEEAAKKEEVKNELQQPVAQPEKKVGETKKRTKKASS